jgi:beta-alanine--pyruvate transaminase
MLDKSPRPTAVNVPNDLAAHWMPFTANRAFKKAPRLLAGAKDMFYFTVDGRKIIDAAAGMWCCNAGHGRPQISEAIGLRAAVPVRHSAGLRARQPDCRSGAQRPRSRVLLQFRI